MAEFCPDCPRRGDCVLPISDAVVLEEYTRSTISDNGRTASLSFERGVPQGPTDLVVKFVDSNDGASEPFAYHGESVGDARRQVPKQLDAIDICKGPIKGKRFGIFPTKSCGAIANL